MSYLVRSAPVLLLSSVLAACGGNNTSGAPVASPTTTPKSSYDTALGGRLFDKWSAETKRNAQAPERLKNLFGWDLRGSHGMYGAPHMDKKTALDIDLLSWPGDVETIANRFAAGEGALPAYGAVLDRAQLEALAAFVVAERDGTLPRADAIVTLTNPAAKDYSLRAGGRAEHGKKLFAERCAGCHGADGTAFMLDEGEYSLGSHARQKAYEDWFKILNGQPGTGMKRQVKGTSASEMAQEILDLLTALCDRTAFPAGSASKPDVADGDPRCGAALR